MNRGPDRIRDSIRCPKPAGRDRFGAGTRDLLRVDESHQHSPAGSGRALYPFSSGTTSALPGLEWPVGCADVLRRLWLSNHFDPPAPLGIARTSQPARFLPASFSRIAPLLLLLLVIL